MADNTLIEWSEATWNPITGCSLASPGCTNCYAMKLSGTRMRHHWSRKGLTRDTKAGPVWTGEVRFNQEWLDQPLRWKRPRLIFVCAHGDLFHESVPDEWIDRVFAVMALAPQHTFQVLTKRSARMREYFSAPILRQQMRGDFVREINRSGLNPKKGCTPDAIFAPYPLRNVWLGVSVEDEQRADERIPDLLATPAAVRWLSCEPLLSRLRLWQYLVPTYPEHPEYRSEGNLLIPVATRPALDWIVAGGESGPGARPMHPDWARELRDDCAKFRVPFFFKQWGDWAPHPSGEPVTIRQYHQQIGYIDRDNGERKRNPNRHTDETMRRIGKKAAGRLLDGVEHSALPEAANA